MSIKREHLAKFIQKVKSEQGNGSIGASTKIPNTNRQIRTGSIMLDYVLAGGIPVGRISLFHGKESSGKTTGALMAIGESQKLCRNCWRPAQSLEVIEHESLEMPEVVGYCDCFQKGIFKPVQYGLGWPDGSESNQAYAARIKTYQENSFEEVVAVFGDLEGTYDPSWAARFGVDSRRVVLLRESTSETFIDTWHQMLCLGEVDLMILDSIAAMTPSKVLNDGMDAKDVALGARLMSKGIRMWQNAMNQSQSFFGRCPTQIWINQEREKPGVMYGSPTVLPNGKAQLYAASVRVEFRNQIDQQSKESNAASTQKNPITGVTAMDIRFTTKKNKCGPPHRTGTHKLIIDGPRKGEIDQMRQLVSIATKNGLLVKAAGNKWSSPLVEGEFKSKAALLSEFQEGTDGYRRLYGAVVQILMGSDFDGVLEEENGQASAESDAEKAS